MLGMWWIRDGNIDSYRTQLGCKHGFSVFIVLIFQPILLPYILFCLMSFPSNPVAQGKRIWGCHRILKRNRPSSIHGLCTTPYLPRLRIPSCNIYITLDYFKQKTLVIFKFGDMKPRGYGKGKDPWCLLMFCLCLNLDLTWPKSNLASRNLPYY